MKLVTFIFTMALAFAQAGQSKVVKLNKKDQKFVDNYVTSCMAKPGGGGYDLKFAFCKIEAHKTLDKMKER